MSYVSIEHYKRYPYPYKTFRTCYMLACHNFLTYTMFGLPDITIIAVGGTVLVITILLLYWGLSFKGHD